MPDNQLATAMMLVTLNIAENSTLKFPALFPKG